MWCSLYHCEQTGLLYINFNALYLSLYNEAITVHPRQVVGLFVCLVVTPAVYAPPWRDVTGMDQAQSNPRSGPVI